MRLKASHPAPAGPTFRTPGSAPCAARPRQSSTWSKSEAEPAFSIVCGRGVLLYGAKRKSSRRGTPMPINPGAVGSKGTPRKWAWDSRDALLYSLGVGCGVADPVGAELQFTTENTMGVDQKVLPTFGVLSSFNARGGKSAMSEIGTYDPRLLVHGEQGIRLHRPIPVEGEIALV